MSRAAFFVWNHDELAELAGPAVAAWYGAVPEGNWEGSNVLWTPRPPAAVAAEAGIPEDELAALITEGRSKLFEARERSVHPATDDKVLAAWNGLAISALAEAGRTFGEPRLVARPCRRPSSCSGTYNGDGDGCYSSWRDGRNGGDRLPGRLRLPWPKPA